MATMEEAKICLKCGQSGNIRIDTPDKFTGGRMLHIYCENPFCEWFNTPWQVSVRADGTIPDPTEHTGPKQFFDIEHDNEEAQRILQYLTDLDQESKKNNGPKLQR